MRDSVRFKLHRKYRTPRFRYGARVQDVLRGEVQIVGISDARIPWPIGAFGPRKAPGLILYRDLAKAIERESVQAVAHWWGITPQTVTRYRRLAGIEAMPEGTRRVKVAYFNEPWAERVRELAWAKARDPERRAKIAAARRGKPRAKHVIEALVKANTGKKRSVESRQKQSATVKRLGIRPPKAGRAWTPDEEALLHTLPAAEVAKRTGRTLAAVYVRRQRLGLEDGRRTRMTKAAKI